MTDLRQAAQQALEALESGLAFDAHSTVLQNLRTALALAREHAMHELARLGQEIEQEPSAWRDMVVVNLVREGVNKHKARELADHFAAQPEQEPVAWMHANTGSVASDHEKKMGYVLDGMFTIPLYTTPPAAQPEPMSMRMPKVGDKVICLEDESIGEIVSLTAGGSPDITFDDGSHGTYMLGEFAKLFGYVTPPAAQPEPPPEWEAINNIIAEYGLDAIAFVAEWKAAQRQWVGLTDEDFLEACQIAERGNYLVAFKRIQTKLKERNT
jgi:hypothetical protein